jgi:putative ABC transport system permease protein
MSAETIHYSLRNLSHRKGRSFLTIFSILIGIATIFIFISFGLGLYQYTDSFTTSSSVDKLLIMAKGAGAPGMDDTFKLTDDDLRTIDRSAGVLDASGVYYDTAKVEKNNQQKYVFIISYNPKKPLIMDIFNVGVEKGRPLQSGDNGVVLGYNYLLENKIFEKPLDINDVIEINGNNQKVIGFLESVGNPQDDSQIYVTNEKFLDMYPEKDTYAQIVARVDIKKMDKTIENIEKALRKQRDLEKGKEDFYVQSFEDMIESFSGALNVIIGFVILIALISVIVSAVNTANTMITSVLERYKEIGILKSIGARNIEILKIFLFESAFLGLIAGLLGASLGLGITSVAKNILQSLGYGFLQPAYSFIFKNDIFIYCVLFAILTGTISGIAPAIKASKTNAVDALRYE